MKKPGTQDVSLRRPPCVEIGMALGCVTERNTSFTWLQKILAHAVDASERGGQE